MRRVESSRHRARAIDGRWGEHRVRDEPKGAGYGIAKRTFTISVVVLLRPPLRKVALASAVIYGVTATVDLVLPAHLSTTQVSWVLKPWLGAYTFTFEPSSLPSAVMSLASAGLLVILVAFYLDHCVVDQPWWAILGGWAPMLSGVTLSQVQSAFGAWWVNVDINHSGFQLAWCEMFVGCVGVAASWLSAPGLFSPRLSRLWVAVIVGAISALPLAQSTVGGSYVAWVVAASLLVVGALIVGSREQWPTRRPPTANALQDGASHLQASGEDPVL